MRVGLIDTGVDVRAAGEGGAHVEQAEEPAFDTAHGTAVARELVSGLGEDATRVGVRSYPAVTASGGATAATLSAGIAAAAADGVDVLVVSLAATDGAAELESAVRDAVDRGILVIAAAGNTAGQRAGYPARYEGVVSVGATDDVGAPLPTSAGHDVDVWAHGSASAASGESRASGTSVAVAVHAAARIRELVP